jgi:hypothetical protein
LTGTITRGLGSIAALGLMLAAFVPGVSASASVKAYSAALQTPASAVAGAPTTFTFTVTNSVSSTNTVGSVQIALPSGFSALKLGAASAPAGPWEESIGNCVPGSPPSCTTVLQVDTANVGGARKLNPGQSVTFTLTATAPLRTGTYTWNTAAMPSSDFSGSSIFVLSGSEPSVTVVAPPATSLAVSGLPAGGVTAGQAFSFTVNAVSAYGTPASGYAGTVHFTTSDQGAGVSLPADYIFTAADQGSHVFSNGATLTTAGLRVITATDASVASITGSGSVTVHAGAAARLVLSAPAASVAGSSIAATVTLFDAFGNQATGYAGTITFTSSDHGAQTQLPTAYTFTSSDAGTHGFTVILTTAGSQTVTASDALVVSLTSMAPVSVTAAAAAALQISGLPLVDVPAGQSFSATVSAVDQFGNLVTGYRGTVQFTTSDHGSFATLPPNYTFGAGDAGMHLFSNGFMLTTLGAQSITATDVGNPALTGGGGLTIKPGPASRLTIVAVTDEATGLTQPVKGQAFDVSVITKDAYGNLAPVSQPTTIQLSLVSGTGTGTLSGTLTSIIGTGQSQGTIAGAAYSVAENGVVLVVSSVAGDSLQPAQTKTNIQALAAFIIGSPGVAATLGSNSCLDASPVMPTCAITTFQHGVNGKALLSEGACSGVASGCLSNGGEISLLMNVAANMKDANGQPLYSRTDPALTIVECDKTLCANAGVNKFVLLVDLNGTGQYVQAPGCPAKGTIAPTGVPFCVDYFTSHRDGSGDTLLYFDFAIDYIIHF